MPVQTVYALGASQISVSGGEQLSGNTQGDGSHLNGETITLNSNAWEGVLIDDDDSNFADNDTGQRLDGGQTFDGVNYANNRVVEAEYQIIVEDSDGIQYTLFAFNIREPGPPNTYGTVEGLAFLENTAGTSAFPPIGEPLTVISTAEGPITPYASLATPPCFTPGTLIDTPTGPRDVAALAVGDTVLTLDHGPQLIRWVGKTDLSRSVLAAHPRFRPIRIAPNAFGPGQPNRVMHVSPQHRIFVSGWRAQLHFGHDAVLAAATKLRNGHAIRRDDSPRAVTYIHLLFDRHEVIWSDGLLSESYFPAAAEPHATAAELAALFPDQFGPQAHQIAARPCLSDRRAVVLAA